MGRTRTRGISLETDGARTVNKVWRGQRIFARLGQVSQEEAEQWLRDEITRRDIDGNRRRSAEPLFADGAKRYLIESQGKNSAENIAWHIKMLLPYIGKLPLRQIHDGTLEAFKMDRLAGFPVEDGKEPRPVSPTTVNRTLEVVRTILNRSARAWRDESGRPLLDMAPPLIAMLDENRRPPYPLSWEEQDDFFPELADHLQTMALFGVNTGLRDENICGLRWEWEVPIPEIGRSVFIIPPSEYKTKVPHVAILNDAAWSIIERQRARLAADTRKEKNGEFVFTYADHRVDTMNNGGWQRARAKVGLQQVRVHDLRHTYATRLRLAGVAQEDRNALMGHKGASIPELYASADIGRLVDLSNLVLDRRGTRTVLRVVNG